MHVCLCARVSANAFGYMWVCLCVCGCVYVCAHTLKLEIMSAPCWRVTSGLCVRACVRVCVCVCVCVCVLGMQRYTVLCRTIQYVPPTVQHTHVNRGITISMSHFPLIS